MEFKKKNIKRLLIFLYVLSFLSINGENRDSLYASLSNLEDNEKILKIHQLTRACFFEEPIKARDLSLEALNLSKKINNDSLIAYSYNYLGLAYYFMDYWNLSVDNYKKSMETKHAKKSLHFSASLANNIAIDYELLGEFDKSAEYYYRALKIKEKQKDSLFIAKVYLNLGLLDIKMNKPDEAIKKFAFALPIFQKERDFRNVANSYQNLSIAEHELGNLSKAKYYFKKAITNSTDSLQTTAIYLDYSSGLFKNKSYEQALINYRTALQYSDSVRSSATYFNILRGIGKSLLYNGKISEAEKYLLLSEKGLKRNEAALWLQSCKLNLAQLYARNGNWKNFNKYLDEYSELQKENLQKEEVKAAKELSVIYQTEKKNKKIEFQKREIENKNNRILFISIIAVLISIGLFVLIFLTKKLKFANKNLINKNLELSERWEQLKKFYGTVESDYSKRTQNQLFHRIYKLMIDKQIYTKPDITVDFISKQLKSNTKYISKAIKEETGMNFNTFVNTFRIEEAKRLLKGKISGTWSLDAVAEQSGFNNTTSFFQAFKKNTGLTPSAFRNALITSFFE